VSRHADAIQVFYGDRFRNDNLNETWARTLLIGGSGGNSEIVIDLEDIRQVIGINDGDTDLSAYLTNQVAEYLFGDLPDVTPSVVEALNTLNAQVGDRTYTGTILTTGETIVSSLQALADAIANADFVRTIERLTADINAGTAHTIPSAQTYTLDGTDNGQNMTLFWRGLIRSPGPLVDSNDYEETSTTQFTPYTKIKSGDHINYYIYA